MSRPQNPSVGPFLVVAPTSVVANWVAEAARFAPDLSVVERSPTPCAAAAPTSTSWSRAPTSSSPPTRCSGSTSTPHADRAWSGLILDEAQYVKNHQAKTYQCARELAAPFKLAITGTPMENNLMELWSLLSITAPGLFPDPTKFADYYAKPIEKTRRPRAARPVPPPHQAAREAPHQGARGRRPAAPSRNRSSTSTCRRDTARSTTRTCSANARRCSACSTTSSATASRS